MPAQVVETDPYRTWLGIQDSDRPLNPYQLLALKPLEADQAKIRAAYQLQVAALSRQNVEKDPTLWEEIQREVDEAFALLADSEQKAMLDAAIRRRGGESHPANPAGSAASGTAVTCRHCQRQNPANRRFCGGCGQSLWEKCPQCGAEASAEERFCGTCGADIVGGLAAKNQQCQQQFQEALRLAGEHRFDAAITALRTLAAIEDPRLESWAQQALEQIPQVEGAKRAALAAAEQALTSARQQLNACAFEQAQSTIEGVPTRLRGPEHDVLLERATACRQELLALNSEIRTAIEQKSHGHLLPKLERLLVLKPDHVQAKKLAEQLRDNLLKSAKARFSQHKYREALDALEQVPSFVRSEEVETLNAAAGELESLLIAVRGAPLATQQLLGLADRFCKLASGNPEAAQLRGQIAEKCKLPPPHPRLAAPDWKPAAQTHVGVPVDWLANILRAECTTVEIRQTLLEHPGQFFTAFGLALQGVGLASSDCDLTPPAEKSGILARLPSLSFGRGRTTPAWGLELGEDALKAIKLSRAGKDDTVKIEACEFILHSRPLTACDEIQRRQVAVATLQDFVGRASELKGQKVVVALPGQRVLGRFFELPAMPAKKVADSIQFEAKHQIPIPLEELCWSHQILGTQNLKSGTENQPRRVLLQAARARHVRDWCSQFKDAGLNVDIVQSDALALAYTARYELFESGPEPDASQVAAPIAILDVGIESSNMVIVSADNIWFRTFSQGGDALARELVKQLNLTREQAEQLLREPHKARSFSALQKAIQPILLQLASEVDRSLATYARHFAEQPIERLYCLGAAIQSYGILWQLRG